MYLISFFNKVSKENQYCFMIEQYIFFKACIHVFFKTYNVEYCRIRKINVEHTFIKLLDKYYPSSNCTQK